MNTTKTKTQLNTIIRNLNGSDNKEYALSNFDSIKDDLIYVDLEHIINDIDKEWLCSNFNSLITAHYENGSCDYLIESNINNSYCSIIGINDDTIKLLMNDDELVDEFDALPYESKYWKEIGVMYLMSVNNVERIIREEPSNFDIESVKKNGTGFTLIDHILSEKYDCVIGEHALTENDFDEADGLSIRIMRDVVMNDGNDYVGEVTDEEIDLFDLALTIPIVLADKYYERIHSIDRLSKVIKDGRLSYAYKQMVLKLSIDHAVDVWENQLPDPCVDIYAIPRIDTFIDLIKRSPVFADTMNKNARKLSNLLLVKKTLFNDIEDVYHLLDDKLLRLVLDSETEQLPTLFLNNSDLYRRALSIDVNYIQDVI